MKKIYKTFLLIILSICIFSNIYAGGGNPAASPSYTPYYITKEVMKIKNLEIPVGAILYYEGECKSKNCEKDKPLNEKQLRAIEFPDNNFLIWGGIPVQMIAKYFNKSMKGFTIYIPHMSKEMKDELTKNNEFARLWFIWTEDLKVDVKDENDWSFNPDNMDIGGKVNAYSQTINLENFMVMIDSERYDVNATYKKIMEHKKKMEEAARKVKEEEIKKQ